MKITWYGTASILIETEQAALMFDPYMKDLPEGKESADTTNARESAFRAQKTVLITHGHLDHLKSIYPLYKDLPCRVYLTKTPYKTLKRRRFPLEKMQQIEAGETLTFGDITVRALQGKHVQFIGKDFWEGFKNGDIRQLPRALRLGVDYFRYPERGEILVYEIEAEGKTIQLMGSAGLCEGIEYRTGADLLILPHQGRSDIDEHNERIVRALQPKRILLDHYDDSFPPYSKDVPLEAFCEKIGKDIPIDKFIEGQTVAF